MMPYIFDLAFHKAQAMLIKQRNPIFEFLKVQWRPAVVDHQELINFQVSSENIQVLAVSEKSPADLVELSVVVPFYNSEHTIDGLYDRLTKVLMGLGFTYEIIFIEDCGIDNSWSKLSSLALKDSRVRSHKLSRNYGQHASITAGLSLSRGKWTIVMDCDLQDPPEYIRELYEKAQSGFDIVLAKRTQRNHSVFRKASAAIYAWLLRRFGQAEYTGNYGSFSILSRNVVDAYLKFTDLNRQYLLILFWLGFERGSIDYEQEERVGSPSSYSLKSLLSHAIQGIFFQTTTLLQWIIALGFTVSASGSILALCAIYGYFCHGSVEGWTSLVVIVLIMGGAILTCLGIVGLYIGQIFEQVKNRPLYVISKSRERLVETKQWETVD